MLCGSQNPLSKSQACYVSENGCSEPLQASYTYCDRQMDFPNLHRPAIRFEALKTDSLNMYKRSIKMDSPNLHRFAGSFTVHKTKSPKVYKPATSFAILKN